MEMVKEYPQYGERYGTRMGDPRWHQNDGWVKMHQEVNGVEIHYVYNTRCGCYDDFKFKDRMNE